MRSSELFARSSDKSDKMQTLDEHLNGVASMMRKFCEPLGSPELGELLGLLHDIGKARPEFQKKLKDRTKDMVEHSGTGATLASSDLKGAARFLSFAIAGHHSGLPDNQDLKNRIERNRAVLSGLGRYSRLPSSVDEASLAAPKHLDKASKDAALSREFWVRMMFSALVDADRLDAEAFELSCSTEDAEGVRGLRGTEASIADLTKRLDAYIDNLASSVDEAKKNDRVIRSRASVLADCRAAASLHPGLFSLTVPTGGGKTLSSMSFALRHAMAHGMRRVICVIPYTSIIEQNAQVYRDALGAENVLEHHSSFDLDRARKEYGDEIADRFERSAENWDYPIIVTTTVQFFGSLFSNRPSKCRKLHNIASSVIILDEAQSLPPSHLHSILDAMRELTQNYGCSIVISTATQPAFEKSTHLKYGLSDIREITSSPLVLPRVRYHWPRSDENIGSWDELADRIVKHDRVLAVVHKRKDARDLTKAIERADPSAWVAHLSAAMCPAHRLEVIKSIRDRLKDPSARCITVSTQLIEAGVDLDFDTVYRALGGLDSITQAAGRCNREGRKEHGDVFIFRYTEPPKGLPFHASKVTDMMLNNAECDGVAIDLDDPEIFKRYFRKLFSETNTTSNVPSLREKLCYQQVADKMKLIDEDGATGVIVPYERSQDLVDRLIEHGWSRHLARALQRYTVQVWPHDLSLCSYDEDNKIYYVEPLSPVYHEKFGLVGHDGIDEELFIL